MTMPRHFILVRHGLSEANLLQAQDKIGDASWFTEEHMTYPDSSWRLARKGILQAQASGEFLKEVYEESPDKKFTRFMVSPFTRTRETAANLGLDKARWEENRLIRERGWGEIDSIPRSLFAEKYSYNYAYKERSPLYWQPPAGESIAQVAENRVRNLLSTLHRECSEGTVLAVTHGEFMWATRLVLERWSDEQFAEYDKNEDYKIHNATVLEYTRINPFTGEETDKLQWVRRSYPIEESPDTFIMAIGDWTEFKRPYLSNQDLFELVEKENNRF